MHSGRSFVVLICISIMVRIKYLSVYLFVFSLVKYLFVSFSCLYLDCLFFAAVFQKFLFYFPDKILYQGYMICKYFLPVYRLSFNLHGIFCRAKFKLMKFSVSVFPFMNCGFGVTLECISLPWVPEDLYYFKF